MGIFLRHAKSLPPLRHLQQHHTCTQAKEEEEDLEYQDTLQQSVPTTQHKQKKKNSMDGRGRPVKREEELGNPRRDEQGNLVCEDELGASPQNDFEGVREAQGSRRPSTTMGADSALPFEQMARLDGREEQDEMLQRRRNGQRRGSRTNLEEVIESNSAAIPASSFLYALQQQRQQQQQMQTQMT